VIPTGRNPDLVVSDLVDQPVLVCDPPKPEALEPVLQQLADTLVSVALDIVDQLIDAFENLSVLSLPPPVVVPGVLIPP